ncbi:hypothetical protein D3C71_1599690 [compost metagenome]
MKPELSFRKSAVLEIDHLPPIDIYDDMGAVRLNADGIGLTRADEIRNLGEHLSLLKPPGNLVEQADRFHVGVKVQVIAAAPVLACPEQQRSRSARFAQGQVGGIYKVPRLLLSHVGRIAEIAAAQAVRAYHPRGSGRNT